MYAQEAPSQTGRAGGAAAGEGVVQVVCETTAPATPASSSRVPAAVLVQQLHHCQVPTLRCDVELADAGMLHQAERLPATHKTFGAVARGVAIGEATHTLAYTNTHTKKHP